MKLASPAFAFRLAAAALLAACATSAGTDDTALDAGKPVDSGKIGQDGNVNQDSGGQDAGDTCVPTCATDLDCQDSCQAPSIGISCCDTATSTCYTDNSGQCPADYDAGNAPD